MSRFSDSLELDAPAQHVWLPRIAARADPDGAASTPAA